MRERAHARLAAAGLTGLAVVLGLESEAAGALLEVPALATAGVTLDVLQWLGVEARQQGTLIALPHVFSYEIHHRCLGILPATALIIAISVRPADFPARLAGICIALPLLLALNVTRLVHLFLVGISQPQVFWFAHHVVWNAVLFASVVLLFLHWLRWTARRAARAARMNSADQPLSKQVSHPGLESA